MLFGETPALQRHHPPSAPGIAIIDPVLYLPEGRRRVSLTVNLTRRRARIWRSNCTCSGMPRTRRYCDIG